MSCLENTKIEETIAEDLEIALDIDYDLRDTLAEKFLEPMEYYLFCKEDHWDLLANLFDEICEALIKVMYANGCEESPACTDIRELCRLAYGIEIGGK